MPIIEECPVVRVKGDKAIVKLIRQPKCDGCKACAFNKRSFLLMTARKETDCVAGDTVMVEMPKKTISGAWLVLFAVPLIFLLVAVCITVRTAWFIQVPAVIGALLAGLVVVVLCDRGIRSRPEYLPTVKEVVKENKDIITGETND